MSFVFSMCPLWFHGVLCSFHVFFVVSMSSVGRLSGFKVSFMVSRCPLWFPRVLYDFLSFVVSMCPLWLQCVLRGCTVSILVFEQAYSRKASQHESGICALPMCGNIYLNSHHKKHCMPL